MDGVDIRIVAELSKYWSIRFVSAPSSHDTWNRQALYEIRDGKSDMALCSSWLSHQNYQNYGLSTFVDNQCGTLLVRSPILISSALYVYYALRIGVWVIILISLIFTAVLLTLVSRYRRDRVQRRNVTKNRLIYEDFLRSILDLTSIISSQSIHLPSYATARILVIRY